jgi:phage terminase large subunit-like protein
MSVTEMLVDAAIDAATISSVTVIGPQPGPQEKFLATPADIAVFGGAAGAGKSYALLMECLRHKDINGFSAVIFRRTYPQITSVGGLWDTSVEMYGKSGGRSRESTVEWMFGSNVRIKFAHMQYESDCIQWDGAQITLIGFDQLEHFTWKQFFYMLSRNRSICGVKPYIRATCNPDPDHWLRKFMAWWIDNETGLPIEDRSGVIRYFIVINDIVYWADSPEVLVKEYGKECTPKSFTFIAGTVEDNKILLEINPEYVGNLNALPNIYMERLRRGNWNIREKAGDFFNRIWFEIVRSAPVMYDEIRYWDRASTDVPEGVRSNASYTAGVRQGRTENGLHFISHVERFRKGPLGVERTVKNTASQDGYRVRIGIEGDPGQAGVAEANGYVRMLAVYDVQINTVRESKAVRVRGDIDLITQKGAPRARTYSAQCQAGNVKIVAADWNEEFLNEHHKFDGTKKCKSDQVDASSGGFYMLTAFEPVGTW